MPRFEPESARLDLPPCRGRHAGNVSFIHRCLDLCEGFRPRSILERRLGQQFVRRSRWGVARIPRYVDGAASVESHCIGSLLTIVLVSYALATRCASRISIRTLRG